MNRTASMLLAGGLFFLGTTACSPTDRLMSALKSGSPEVCQAPEVVQTLAELVHEQDRPKGENQVTTTTDYGAAPASYNDTLTPAEIGVVEKARPMTLSAVTAEHAYKDIGKMECEGTLNFTTPTGSVAKPLTYDVLPDLAAKKVIVRSVGVGDVATLYAANYTSEAFHSITKTYSAAQMKEAKQEKAAKFKDDIHPDFDESLIDTTKDYEVSAPGLDHDTKMHFGWMRAHCKDPSDGREVTNWELGGEIAQDVRSIYLKMKSTHPELLTKADEQCYKDEDGTYRYMLTERANEFNH